MKNGKIVVEKDGTTIEISINQRQGKSISSKAVEKAIHELYRVNVQLSLEAFENNDRKSVPARLKRDLGLAVMS